MLQTTWKVKVEKDDFPALCRNFAKLSSRAIEVGVFDSELATHAMYNEKGQGVPARPAWQYSVKNYKAQYARRLRQYFRVYGWLDSHQSVLEAFGRSLRQDLRKTIIAWNDPPNAPSTIAKKGFNDPLIETGETLGAVGFEIVRAGALGGAEAGEIGVSVSLE